MYQGVTAPFRDCVIIMCILLPVPFRGEEDGHTGARRVHLVVSWVFRCTFTQWLFVVAREVGLFVDLKSVGTEVLRPFSPLPSVPWGTDFYRSVSL